MREPVVVVVGGHLLLFAAVGLHPPDLHPPGPLRVEVNEPPVRRVFGAVVEPLGRGQALFRTAGDRNPVDIDVTVPLAGIG